MLNRASGRQLETVHEEFFTRWPTALDVVLASIDDIVAVLAPLGMQNIRAQRIKTMSDVYVSGRWVDPVDLPGCGRYSADSYQIFIRGVIPDDFEPSDKELRRYVEWARTLATMETDRL